MALFSLREKKEIFIVNLRLRWAIVLIIPLEVIYFCLLSLFLFIIEDIIKLVFILFFIKYFISSFLMAANLDPLAGWFPVGKSLQAEEEPEFADSSIWVLFAKDLGSEAISVRFPTPPTYTYLDSGVLVVFSTRDGERFELTIEKALSGAPDQLDFVYEQEGKWVHERLLQTEHYIYRFKTLSDLLKTAHHEAFITSFSIEKKV